MKMIEGVGVQKVRLIEDEYGMLSLRRELVDVLGDRVKQRRGRRARGQPKHEAKLSIEVSPAERGIVAIGDPKLFRRLR